MNQGTITAKQEQVNTINMTTYRTLTHLFKLGLSNSFTCESLKDKDETAPHVHVTVRF
jgi:hypothetical protein